MADETVTLVLDAEQYYREIAKITRSTAGLSRTGSSLGDGFLKGERVVESATRSITTGLLTASSAGDAFATTMEGLSRVLKLPLATGIAATAGVTAAVVLAKEFEKTRLAEQALRRAVAVPLKVQVALSPEDIAARIATVHKAVDGLVDRQDDLGEKAARFFAGAVLDFGRVERQSKEIAEGQRRIVELGAAQADAELKIVNLKGIELSKGKDAATVAKSQLDVDMGRAKLVEEMVAIGGNTLDLYKRLLALQLQQKFVSEEIKRNNEIELKSEQDTTTEMKLQASGQETAAKLAKIRLDTEQKIAAALRAGKAELAAQIDIQGKLASAAARREGADPNLNVGFTKQLAADTMALSAQAAAKGDLALAQKLFNDAQKLLDKVNAHEEGVQQLQADAEARLGLSGEGGATPIPGGRTAGIGESQELVNEIEANRIAFEALSKTVDDAQVQMSGLNAESKLTADDFTRMGEGLNRSDTDALDDFERSSEGFAGFTSDVEQARTALQELATMDFRGLLPLDGLTITIE